MMVIPYLSRRVGIPMRIIPSRPERPHDGARRPYAIKALPGSNPLDLLRQLAEKKNVCNEHGFRRPGTHWAFALSVPSDSPDQAPNLRTIGFQRLSQSGIDFILKRGPHSVQLEKNRLPVSFLHNVGRYRPGETVEQWRADGFCEKLDLTEILHNVAHYTISEMVASKRAADKSSLDDEEDMASFTDQVSKDRMIMKKQTHFMELVQQTRAQLEHGQISMQEMNDSLSTWRFVPHRMERMVGGPELIMWDRWEWLFENEDWNEPKQLLPY